MVTPPSDDQIQAIIFFVVVTSHLCTAIFHSYLLASSKISSFVVLSFLAAGVSHSSWKTKSSNTTTAATGRQPKKV